MAVILSLALYFTNKRKNNNFNFIKDKKKRSDNCGRFFDNNPQEVNFKCSKIKK